MFDTLDTPQLLIDLDVVDANLQRMFGAYRNSSVNVRVHFKSLKCAGLAKYIAAAGGKSFLCAKLSEAEVLVDAGFTDVYIANQIVGPIKLKRLGELARRAQIRVCIDDSENLREMAHAAWAAGSSLGVLVEVNLGMNRCGVEPGEPAVVLAKLVDAIEGVRFVGLQGYDGHLQQVADPVERRERCLAGIARLIETRRMIEAAGIPVEVVTGAGTGTGEYVGACEGITEIQPGSFVLMDASYHKVRPEYGCALSILASVISRQSGRYILDAGSKAISQDFGPPVIKNHPEDKVGKLSEEHARVESSDTLALGERREVIPSHCCATMNLHRRCIAVRKGNVEAIWPIEASGRYD
jgi:D-serine deaminase-like pyridoxal phosphate-dependent protein